MLFWEISRQPEVLWAQRSDKVYLTISLPDAKNISAESKPQGLFTFSATGKQGEPFSFSLELYGSILPEASFSNSSLMTSLILVLICFSYCAIENLLKILCHLLYILFLESSSGQSICCYCVFICISSCNRLGGNYLSQFTDRVAEIYAFYVDLLPLISLLVWLDQCPILTKGFLTAYLCFLLMK